MKSTRLTPPQQLGLDHIRRDIESKGYAPTRRELQQYLGYSSPKSADDVLQALSSKGYIQLAPGVSRGIKLLPQSDDLNNANRSPSMGITEDDIDLDRLYVLINDFQADDASNRSMANMIHDARDRKSEAAKALGKAQSDTATYKRRQRDVPHDLARALNNAEQHYEQTKLSFEKLTAKRSAIAQSTGRKRNILERIAEQLKSKKIHLSAMESF